ncbi:penicillin-binding protein activator [Coralloluteibacterium stylophorae]|uniref:Penicillin-binding protein activator n=1 Tax=Coralloluteibacterium stylophorae TaxID=1776034 RepID=A0A8J7VUZ8_9GAMM|nr:penicillin-binding protein activator [Coralloluteibacterium stylophorae]MBS7457752.1 penicillin-binding protein activator [Coralloluteibacterium stylophorae]
MNRLIALCALLFVTGCASVMVDRGGGTRRAASPERAAEQLDRAQAASALGEAETALASLEVPAEQVPEALRARWHPLRADLLERTGDDFGAASELAWAAPTLAAADRAGNAQRIAALLGRLPDHELASRTSALPPGHPLYDAAARAMMRRGLTPPRAIEGGVVAGADTSAWPPADPDGYRPPERVAVLLPLSGDLAAAGEAVRDGYLTALYGEHRRVPAVRFYDSEVGGAGEAYAQAVAEGAQLVVGPLAQEEVAALFARAPQVPLLALNRVDTPPPPGSVSFSLAPEDEGVAVAERLLQRGLRRVLVIVGGDDHARRSAGAFRQRLAQQGGEIVDEIALTTPGPDYTPMLVASPAMGGFDAVFLAMRAPQARLLVPQLTASGLGGRPMLATSLILSGGGNPQQDRELDGVEYPELPWALLPQPGLPDAASLGDRLPSARGNALRLFAFGVDAWKLTAYLDMLAGSSESGINGATGELGLDAFGNVTRTPAWAMFSGGRTRPALDGALIPEPVQPVGVEEIGGDGGAFD